MKYDVCIYHANCYDGFTSAWIANRWGGVIDLRPFDYGQRLPLADYEGKHVLIADFSFPAQTLRNLAQYAASVTVLDHHKSAAEQLREFEWHDNWDGSADNIRVKFDMAKSGAMLTWEHLVHNPPLGTPALIQYIQDRDLWKFEFDNSKEVNAWIMSHDFRLEVWDDLHDHLSLDKWRAGIIDIGEALNRQLQLDIRRALPSLTHDITIAGHTLPCANLPFHMASDAGNILAEQSLRAGKDPAAVIYVDLPGHKRKYSLRSIGDFDVSAIAKQYGGGGHKNAASFTVPDYVAFEANGDA